MKAMDFKTYKGYNSQDIMLTGSQYNALRRNLSNQKTKKVAGTDALLQYATMKRDAQLGRISDREAEAFRKSVTHKSRASSDRKKQVFVNQAKKLSEDVQNQKIKQVESDNNRTAASSNRSIMQFISIQTDRLISRIDDKTARVNPELQTGLTKMKEQIQKAVIEFINDCYIPFMTERIKIMMSQYKSQVISAVEYCCDVIGDQLSEYEGKQIIAQCYRELADGRLQPNRINYFIASRWETACSYKIIHNEL